LLSVILIGIATNLDNLGIGLTYGIRKIRVPLKTNIVISLFSGIAMVLSSYAGNLLMHILPLKFGNVLGGMIVSIIGLYTVFDYFNTKKKQYDMNRSGINEQEDKLIDFRGIIDDPCRADKDYSGDISIKEALFLGIALAINCLGTGIGAGMTGISVWPLALSVMFFSLITISLGVYVGKKYASQHLGEKAAILAGLVLFLVGIYEMFL
jgi:putative sporulation protein YtaF